jgi:hypothetical protein
MKPILFYQVCGTMFRQKGNETDLIEVNKVFKDKNPIVAREQAFEFFQNYIDVFLESKGLKYESHLQAKRELQDFFNSYKKEYLKVGNNIIPELEINVDCDKGLNICYIMEDSETYTTKKGELIYEEQELIHCIDDSFNDYTDTILVNLMTELELYKEFNLNCKNHKQTYDPIGHNDESDFIELLKTPQYFENINLQKSS